MPYVKLLSVNIKKNIRKKIKVSGSNLREIITQLNEKYPGIKNELLNNGKLSRSYNFIVKNRAQRKQIKNLQRTIKKNDIIIIFPIYMGG